MTGGIIRYNFESRHYNDDSDKLWFIVCVGVLYPCLMTGEIIRYNFESRHYKDDSDKLWFKFSQCFQRRRFK